jgi:hypothetical protein
MRHCLRATRRSGRAQDGAHPPLPSLGWPPDEPGKVLLHAEEPPPHPTPPHPTPPHPTPPHPTPPHLPLHTPRPPRRERRHHGPPQGRARRRGRGAARRGHRRGGPCRRRAVARGVRRLGRGDGPNVRRPAHPGQLRGRKLPGQRRGAVTGRLQDGCAPGGGRVGWVGGGGGPGAGRPRRRRRGGHAEGGRAAARGCPSTSDDPRPHPT